MTRTLHKVTAFITRRRGNETDRLLFRHETAGIQIPDGTVEDGEAIDDDALREGREETALDELSLVAKIGSFDQQPPEGHSLILETTDVISRPGGNNLFNARIRNGYGVKVERTPRIPAAPRMRATASTATGCQGPISQTLSNPKTHISTTPLKNVAVPSLMVQCVPRQSLGTRSRVASPKLYHFLEAVIVQMHPKPRAAIHLTTFARENDRILMVNVQRRFSFGVTEALKIT